MTEKHTEYWVNPVGQSQFFDRCCEKCLQNSKDKIEKRGLGVVVKEVGFSNIWKADIHVEEQEIDLVYGTSCFHLKMKSFDYWEEHPEVFD